jgi:hypothetical protein
MQIISAGRIRCGAEKSRLNGFSWARVWFTALKRGVNEMMSARHSQRPTLNLQGA